MRNLSAFFSRNVLLSVFVIPLALLAGATPLYALDLTVTSLQVSGGGSIVAGAPVTLIASVAHSGSAVAPGQVRFCKTPVCTSTGLLGYAQLTSAGTATLVVRPAAGTLSLYARFMGTTSLAVSQSSAQPLTVTPVRQSSASLTTLSSAMAGGAYTLSSTVMGIGTSAAVTGNVSFLDTSHSNAVVAAAALGGATSAVSIEGAPTAYSGPIPSAVGDFNNDGYPDVVFIGSNGLEVDLGHADGTVTQGYVHNWPDNAGIIGVGDFNSDGNLDIAFTGAYNTIYVLLGHGDSTFSNPVGSHPYGADLHANFTGTFVGVVGDYNRDGILDLAVVNTGVSLLAGHNDGTFAPALPTDVVYESFYQDHLFTGDYNGDGYPDLMITTVGPYVGGSATVLLNDGDGTFKPNNTQIDDEIVFGDYDFNGDGKTDLAGWFDFHPDSGGLTGTDVSLSVGDGTFNETVDFNTLYGGIMVGDFDGDGKLDVLVNPFPAGQYPGDYPGFVSPTAFQIGNGDGTFHDTPYTAIPGSTGGSPNPLENWTFAPVDYNGDGLTDLYPGNLTRVLSTASATATGVTNTLADARTIRASYGGDAVFAGSMSPNIITIPGAPPAGLQFSISNKTYGSPVFFMTATSPSPSPITYSVVSGPATVYGQRLGLNSAGNVTVRATQAASGSFPAASTNASFTVLKALQTITFQEPPARVTVGANPIALDGTASSGLPVTFLVLSGPATISGNHLLLTGPGYITVSAQQLGNGNYFASSRVNYQIQANPAP